MSTEWRRVYENGGVFLFDEIDNGHPGIIAELNAALANGVCAFPDAMVKRHVDCLIVAAANTYGTGPNRQFVGRNTLDAATLDRFVMVEVGIDEELERELVLAEIPGGEEKAEKWLDQVRRYRRNVERHGLHVVISPRASIEGARLIGLGFSVDEVVGMRVLRGLTADVQQKIQGV